MRTEIGKDPDQSNDGVEKDGGGGVDVSGGDGQEVAAERHPVFARGRGIFHCAPAGKTEAALDGETKQHEGEAGRKQGKAVEDDGEAVTLFFKHPGGEVRKKRGTEEKEQIGVEDAAIDLFNAMDEEMVIDPIDAGEGEGEDVDEEDGKDGMDAGDAVRMRDLELEHHDGDDDGEDAVREGLEAGRGEGSRVIFLGHGR